MMMSGRRTPCFNCRLRVGVLMSARLAMERKESFPVVVVSHSIWVVYMVTSIHDFHEVLHIVTGFNQGNILNL